MSEFFICTMLNFKKNKKTKQRKTPGDSINLHMWTKNIGDITYSSWDIECGRLKLVIMGHFLPFYLLKMWKIRILKKQEIAKDVIILHMCTKNHKSYEVQLLRYEVKQKEFFVILGHC